MGAKRKRRYSWIPSPVLTPTPTAAENDVPSSNMKNVLEPEPVLEDDSLAFSTNQGLNGRMNIIPVSVALEAQANTQREGEKFACQHGQHGTPPHILPNDAGSDLYEIMTAATRCALRHLLGAVALSLVISWLLGAAGLSMAWLLLLLAVVITKWNSQVASLVSQARWEEIQRVRRRRALNGSETAEWLNVIINRWWVSSGQSIFRIVRERFEPLLNESKPSFVEKIQLEQFTVGDQTPCVQTIRSFDVSSGMRRPVTFDKNCLRSTRHQTALEIGFFLNSDEFRMILRARLFGKGVGMDVDVAMEKLYICGKLAVTFTVDLDSPFPHVSNVSICFVEKPEVWFSIRMLKTLQMMEVPILKTWLHSVVVDALESALVDPGQISFNPGGAKHDAPTPDNDKNNSLAQGVLIVALSSAIDYISDGEQKWMVLRIGEQTWRTTPIAAGWEETPCFLINSLQKDRLVVKLKNKRLVSTVTLAQYEMSLDEYNLDTTQSVETHLQKKNPRLTQVPSITLRLEYAALPVINLEQPPLLPPGPVINCGVLTIFVHGAEGLSSNESYQCNPYCMVFNNRRKVKSTPYLLNTVSPQWKARCQLLVNDYSQASLSFVICSWNPKKMTDDEMLGVAVFNVSQGDMWVVNKQLPLSGSPNATLKMSVCFQPVARMCGDRGEMAPDVDESGRIKRNSSSWVNQAKNFLGRGDGEIQSGTDISNILASGLGLMEITIIRARDLVAMDMNGFSDPYCELKVNSECKYKSSVKKKTLNPSWEENAIMAMPRQGETFDVMVWDHDTFGMKDFLGNVTLNLEEIRQMSSQGDPLWFTLQGVRSGEVQLRIKIISEDISFDAASIKSSFGRGSAEPSPVPRRASMERSRVRLGVHVPPPTPPRTVSIPRPQQIAPRDSPEPCVPILTITDSPCLTRASSQASSHLTVDSLPPSPVNETANHLKKPESEMSGFRFMRLKVTRSLRLRRFKSELNVRGNSNGRANGAIPSSPTEPLNHAVSQPNINKPQAIRPTELNLNNRPDVYTGVEGRVIQAQGLHVAHVAQLYCRIKILGAENARDKHGLGKTLAKSHLLPAMPNPQFQLDFQVSSPETVPRQAALLFEIRSSAKEVLALRRVTLQDLLAGDLKQTHTWLALNNGATLEVSIGHGHTIKKKSKKLFRSWSVHRIGKI